MSLRDFWKKIDAMAEEQRLKIPVWCVWDSRDPESGYALYRCVTREEAVGKFWKDLPEGYDADIKCAPATQSQIDEHRKTEEGWGAPPGPINPRLRMEKI